MSAFLGFLTMLELLLYFLSPLLELISLHISWEMAVQAEVEAGKMAVLSWARPLQVMTQMIWHREKWLSPAFHTFLEMLTQMEW